MERAGIDVKASRKRPLRRREEETVNHLISMMRSDDFKKTVKYPLI